MSTPPAEPLPPADVQATFAATLVDDWVRAGLTDAVVCPGSRSTPLALALAAHAGVRVHVHHDERSGAFLALGLGLGSGRPALVLTTSGTAAAELHATVVEADLAAVPLLACTADRPPELRDVGAPQAIDQVHLFGRAVRWFGDPGVPDAGSAGRWRAFAARAHAMTLGARPGPVHLNLPFREPLVGAVGDLPPARPEGQPWTSSTRLAAPAPSWTSAARGADPATSPDTGQAPLVPAGSVPALARLAGRRGVLVAGACAVAGDAVHEAAGTLGWPVLAEPRSPAWRDAPALVHHLDALLRSTRAAENLRPEVVVRLGPPGASRVVDEWLAASGAVEVVAGAPGWSDPSATATVVDGGDPAVLLSALASAADAGTPPDGWLGLWQAASAAAARAVEEGLAGETRPSEPAIARAVVRAMPAASSLVVSSSMPIRDVERYARPVPDIRVVANRGANGIDGVVSTAVGVAAATGAPTGLLIGDVAFLHDSNGLLGAPGRAIDLTCVVVDNDGGGIFSFLPQARALAPDRFEALFGTPHGLDLVALASAYGVDARRLGPGDDVGAAVASAVAKGGVQVLVVTTDRHANAEAHRRLDEAAAAAVDAALAGPVPE
jgi:2-succinyl-5-enolpyruvyl-6-hydroxy-3-cyclohexene-1-carboxylate synthase